MPPKTQRHTKHHNNSRLHNRTAVLTFSQQSWCQTHYSLTKPPPNSHGVHFAPLQGSQQQSYRDCQSDDECEGAESDVRRSSTAGRCARGG